MGANSGQRAALARGKQQQKGAERRAGVIALSETARLAAAGCNIGDDDVEGAETPMFEADVDTGLEIPSSGIWSCGPKGMGN